MKRKYAFNADEYKNNLQNHKFANLFSSLLAWTYKAFYRAGRSKSWRRGKSFLTFFPVSMVFILSAFCFLSVSPLWAMQNNSMEDPSPVSQYISISRSHPVDLEEHKEKAREVRETNQSNDRYGNLAVNVHIHHLSGNVENYAHGVLIHRKGIDKQEENEVDYTTPMDGEIIHNVPSIPSSYSHISISEISKMLMSNGKAMKISALKALPHLAEGGKPNQQSTLIPQISLMLRDEDWEVRKCAFRALRNILKQKEAHAWDRLCQEISYMLEKLDRCKRKAVLKALRGLFKDQSPEAWDLCLPHLTTFLEVEDTHIKEAVKQLINQHAFIPRKTSHRILRAIKEDSALDTLRLPAVVKIKQLEELKINYQKKKKKIEQQDNNNSSLSNLPFYLIIHEKYPNFSWKKSGKNVHFTFPDTSGWQPSLLSLLLTDIKKSPYMSLRECFSVFPHLPSSLVPNLSKLLENIDALQPNPNSMADILKWIEAGLQGKSLILFSPVCPDYSVVKEENGLYRYTFNELGSGVGLLAKRLITILPRLDEFFKQYSLPVTIKVALGDFEALSESNLQRLHVTFDEFLFRLNKSKIAIQQSTSVPIEVMMITDMCGGHSTWNTYYLKYKELLTQNEYGFSKLDNAKLLEIIKARKPLYDRWQGERARLEDYLPQLLGQGAEYAAMGAIIVEKYPNCLVLGVDQPVMRPFYNVKQPFPILYLRPCYS